MDKDTKDILKVSLIAVVLMGLVLLSLWMVSGRGGATPHRHGDGELHTH